MSFFCHLEPVGYPRVSTSGSGFVGFGFFAKVRVRVCRVSLSKFGFSGFRVPDPALIATYDGLLINTVWKSSIKRDHAKKVREINSIVTSLLNTLI